MGKGRWRKAHVINPRERKLLGVSKPFILVKTLRMLESHLIATERVNLFVNSEQEKVDYRKALAVSERWKNVNIIVGVDGILEQRNFIVKYYPEGKYIISIDDDVECVYVKNVYNPKALDILPAGGIESIIFDAMARMSRYPKAHIWGLHSTAQKNFRNMRVDGISTRNGEINGFFYGFRNRHNANLLPRFSNAIEDAERSVRYFARDGIVLRYRMYCCETRCFDNGAGLQHTFGQVNVFDSLKESNDRRKDEEKVAAKQLHVAFPNLVSLPKEKAEAKTLTVEFKRTGGSVIPSTTAELLKEHSDAEKFVDNRDSRNIQASTLVKRSVRNTPPKKKRKVCVSGFVDVCGSESITDSESPEIVEIEDDDEADAEDEQLFAALEAIGPRGGMPEDERLYLAWVRSYNGHQDPYQVAVVQSEKLQKEMDQEEKEENDLLRKALDESTRLMNEEIKEKLPQLIAMGFPATDAETALRDCDGNVDRAVEKMLEG